MLFRSKRGEEVAGSNLLLFTVISLLSSSMQTAVKLSLTAIICCQLNMAVHANPSVWEPELDEDSDMPDLTDIQESDESHIRPAVPPKTPQDAPKVHQEKAGFTGDPVLRNSQIFLQDFGWWI